MRTQHAGVLTLVQNSIQQARCLFGSAIWSKNKKKRKKKTNGIFFIRRFDYFSQKKQFKNFELSAFRHAFFPTWFDFERASSGQETLRLEHKLRTTINITKNTAASKMHTPTSCFHHVCWQLNDMNFFPVKMKLMTYQFALVVIIRPSIDSRLSNDHFALVCYHTTIYWH